MQFGRLSALVNGRESASSLGRRVPVSTPAERVEPSEGASSGSAGDWLELPECPACRTSDRTIVCEWNKLVLLDTAPDERACRYDYAVCHGCGILYATQRPVGARYCYLVDHFEDVIDKNASNPLLNPHPLTDEDRERYRQLIGARRFRVRSR